MRMTSINSSLSIGLMKGECGDWKSTSILDRGAADWHAFKGCLHRGIV